MRICCVSLSDDITFDSQDIVMAYSIVILMVYRSNNESTYRENHQKCSVFMVLIVIPRGFGDSPSYFHWIITLVHDMIS